MVLEHTEIAKRAYSIWEAEGRPLGNDVEIWLRAERELSAATGLVALLELPQSTKAKRSRRRG